MKLRCEVCGEIFEGKNDRQTNQRFTYHIKKHGYMTRQSYYDEFLKRKNDGLCKICNKETKFYTTTGYATYCSNQCRGKDPEVSIKISKTVKKLYEEDETYRQRVSEGTKKALENSEVRKKMSEANKKRCEDPEHRKFLSDISKKIWENPEYKKMHSEKATKQIFDKNDNFGKRSNRGSYGEYKQTGIFMRSEFERKFASVLDKNNIKWKYESKTFIINEIRRYTPDFYLLDYDLFIELRPKYFIDEKLLKNIECLKNKHNKRIVIISEINNDITSLISEEIKLWHG